MLGNCEKMVVISSTTSNEWSQIDEKGLMDSSSKVMEKPNQDQNQQQQQQSPLKCPRCDSSNTKFCYYNNYSLSQPRHFCKACKRYWTRGGTLRNVPVGGGCRKNKRVKRPALASDANSPSSAQQTVTSNPSVVPPGHSDRSSSTSNHVNPLFYSLLTNHPSELNLPYPRFNTRVSGMNSVNGYDLQPHMNGCLGLGFSSGLLASDVTNKQIQDDAVHCNSLLSSYNPIFESTSTSTMASLIASSLNQQKIVFSGLKNAQEGNNFQGFEQFEGMQMPPRNGEVSLVVKDVKMEEGHSSLDWIGVANNNSSNNNNNNRNHIDQISFSDPSLLWNTTGIGAWLDPSNVGSSVPSLI